MTAGYTMLANEARNMAEDFENHAGDLPPRSTTATLLRQLAAAVDDLLADYHTQYDEIERLARLRGALFEISQLSARTLEIAGVERGGWVDRGGTHD